MPTKMETKRTNKPLFVRGLKTMGLTLVTLFLGPVLLHIGLANDEKSLYIPLVITGVLVSGVSIYLGFIGVRMILDSIFK
ncbi:MAG: hypothetical protein CMC83_00425 [Flavobacteriaceae bacterium]|nr:hypothetical protein [Flavobacteriaceae bacterium]